MPAHEKINYLELPANDLDAVKSFFAEVFGWVFVDYGPEYTAFDADQTGLDGGFYKAPLNSDPANGAALAVFYSQSLTTTQTKIETAGGEICKAIFSFPGGRRFHFIDPNGNEFAVWSDK